MVKRFQPGPRVVALASGFVAALAAGVDLWSSTFDVKLTSLMSVATGAATCVATLVGLSLASPRQNRYVRFAIVMAIAFVVSLLFALLVGPRQISAIMRAWLGGGSTVFVVSACCGWIYQIVSKPR